MFFCSLRSYFRTRILMLYKWNSLFTDILLVNYDSTGCLLVSLLINWSREKGSTPHLIYQWTLKRKFVFCPFMCLDECILIHGCSNRVLNYEVSSPRYPSSFIIMQLWFVRAFRILNMNDLFFHFFMITSNMF